MPIYISGGAIGLLVFFYAPLVLCLLWMLWRVLPAKLMLRLGVMTITLVIAGLVPLGDVIATSVKMAELCPHTGIFIKRSVNVDGFSTNIGGTDLLDRGFKYIEVKVSDTFIVFYSKKEGVTTREHVDARGYRIKSEYEFIFGQGKYEGRNDIGIEKAIVRERETGEELGYALMYIAYPGWLDQNTFGLLGRFSWRCVGVQPVNTVSLMHRTLLPKL